MPLLIPFTRFPYPHTPSLQLLLLPVWGYHSEDSLCKCKYIYRAIQEKCSHKCPDFLDYMAGYFLTALVGILLCESFLFFLCVNVNKVYIFLWNFYFFI